MSANEKKSASIPKTANTPSAAAVKSNIRNILLASPDFPRLYADVLISEGYNPNEAKILAERYQKNSGINMPLHPSVKVCTHIKVTGVRCGSPALRGEQFCYFHQRMVRGVRTPPQARLHPIALIEDEESIQAALMEVINALARNAIDLKRAALILRALHIAVKNARRVRFDRDRSSMVQEAPDYSDRCENGASCGESRPRLPGGPGSSGRSHVPDLDAFDFTPDNPLCRDAPRRIPSFAEAAAAKAAMIEDYNKPQPSLDPTQRKPPASVKEAEPPQERQVAARHAPGG